MRTRIFKEKNNVTSVLKLTKAKSSLLRVKALIYFNIF